MVQRTSTLTKIFHTLTAIPVREDLPSECETSSLQTSQKLEGQKAQREVTLESTSSRHIMPV